MPLPLTDLLKTTETSPAGGGTQELQPSHQLCIQFFIWLTISSAIELLIELMVELMMIIIDQLMKPIAAIVYHCDCYYYCISHVLSELIHELQYRSRTGKKRLQHRPREPSRRRRHRAVRRTGCRNPTHPPDVTRFQRVN